MIDPETYTAKRKIIKKEIWFFKEGEYQGYVCPVCGSQYIGDFALKGAQDCLIDCKIREKYQIPVFNEKAIEEMR